MKTFLFLLCILSSSYAAETMGVPDGTYSGEGKLVPVSSWVPELKFKSEREFAKGVITAKTTAYLMGVPVAKASARLRFVRLFNKVIVLDLDRLNSVGLPTTAGDGACEAGRCSFKAEVIKGNLHLEETFVPGGDGFQVIDGKQKFSGIEHTYEGQFTLKN